MTKADQSTGSTVLPVGLNAYWSTVLYSQEEYGRISIAGGPIEAR